MTTYNLTLLTSLKQQVKLNLTVKPTQLTIDLPIDYYSQAETIGITQYVTEQARKYFDNIDSYEIRIKDGNTPRALISKSKEDKEPQVHIYNN